MYRFVAVVIVAVLATCTTSKASKVLFVKEHIDVRVLNEALFEVQGEYFFTSGDGNAGVSTLFYPFPIDSASLYPSFIHVSSMERSDSVSFRKNDRGIFFPVTVHPGDTSGIEVVYRQQVKKRSGTYILTTTGAWGRPLRNSSYSVCVPQALTLNYMSYESDSVFVKGKNVVYSFFRSCFMPDRDLFFTWSEK